MFYEFGSIRQSALFLLTKIRKNRQIKNTVFVREKIAQGPVPRGLCYFKNNYLNLPHVIDRVYCELTQL